MEVCCRGLPSQANDQTGTDIGGGGGMGVDVEDAANPLTG